MPARAKKKKPATPTASAPVAVDPVVPRFRDFEELDPIEQIAIEAQILAEGLEEVHSAMIRANDAVARHQQREARAIERAEKRGVPYTSTDTHRRLEQRLRLDQHVAEQTYWQWLGKIRNLRFRVVKHRLKWLHGMIQVRQSLPSLLENLNVEDAIRELHDLADFADHELQRSGSSAEGAILKAFIQCLRTENRRMTGPTLIKKCLFGAGNSGYAKKILACAVADGTLNNTRASDDWGIGYGLPEWTPETAGDQKH